MRQAEEVAREALGCRLTLNDDGWQVCETEHGGEWDCADEEQRITDLIRERDAEVAQAQRQITLAGFEWETTPGPIGTHRGPARRLVGPWLPDERTPEERSSDAIVRLRRRLCEEPEP